MTGILFIALVIAWLCVAAWVTGLATRRIANKWMRFLTGCLLFVALVAFPVADEIVGGVQFRALCDQSQQIHIKKYDAFGKTVTMRDPNTGYVLSHDRDIPNTILPITEREFVWRDIETNEPILSYKSLNVRGGWLIRSLGILEEDTPLLIEKKSCMPDVSKIFSDLGLTKAK